MSNGTGKEDISYSKADIGKGKAPLQGSKTVVFKDQKSAGDTIINTLDLLAPAEANSNGFVQPNGDTLAALNLLVNRKNLKVHSSRGAWLQEYEDYVVTSASTIQVIGNIATLGGFLEGEVITVYATPVQAESIVVADTKRQYQEYVLPAGQTILNLGREYSTALPNNSQIGAIRVYRNGDGPLLVNVGNAPADPLADGNFHMIDTGSGVGTQIEFNEDNPLADDVIVVEFGLEYAGDLSIYGDIESIYGGLLAMANDVGPQIGIDPTTWLTSNPSEIERRTLGDNVLKMLDAQIVAPREFLDLYYFRPASELLQFSTGNVRFFLSQMLERSVGLEGHNSELITREGSVSGTEFTFLKDSKVNVMLAMPIDDNSSTARAVLQILPVGAGSWINLSKGGAHRDERSTVLYHTGTIRAGEKLRFTFPLGLTFSTADEVVMQMWAETLQPKTTLRTLIGSN